MQPFADHCVPHHMVLMRAFADHCVRHHMVLMRAWSMFRTSFALGEL